MLWTSQTSLIPSPVTLAVIGTAGRGADADRLNRERYDFMVRGAKGMIAALEKAGRPVEGLVSGGAAYADHVAVTLFLEGVVPRLTLHLPCPFASSADGFEDLGAHLDWKTNPGRVANLYHRKFTERTGISSLAEIAAAIERGAEVNSGGGMFGRNGRVARAGAALALTFGVGRVLNDGGTAHTMKAYLKHANPDLSAHLDLNTGKLWPNAQVS
jgi:hypothetical protein